MASLAECDYVQRSDVLPYPIIGHPPEQTAFYIFIQPRKDEKDRYVSVPYRWTELRQWEQAIRHVDTQLSALCNQEQNDDNPPVARIVDPKETFPVNDGLNEAIASLLTDKDIGYVGFANGIQPNLTYIYHSVSSEAQQRMFSVIVGGSDGSKIKKTRVLSEIPDEVAEKPLIVAHDDVGDTMAALAAFVEKISVIKSNNSYEYDTTFVTALTATFDKGYNKFGDLYEILIDRMELVGIIAGISFYKNCEFLECLNRRVRERLEENSSSRWAHLQQEFLGHTMKIPENAWAMGEGLDTGINGDELVPHFSADFREDPGNRVLLDYLGQSRVRIGSTIKGLIVLRRLKDQSEYSKLVQWVAQQFEQALRKKLLTPLPQN